MMLCCRYRLTVLRALPHLQKLDNVAVDSEEVQKAMVCGVPLPSSGRWEWWMMMIFTCHASLVFPFFPHDVLWLPVKVLWRCETLLLVWDVSHSLPQHSRWHLLPQRRGREGNATLQQHGGVPEEWVRGRQQPVRLFPALLWETLLADHDPNQSVPTGMTLHCLPAVLWCKMFS